MQSRKKDPKVGSLAVGKKSLGDVTVDPGDSVKLNIRAWDDQVVATLNDILLANVTISSHDTTSYELRELLKPGRNSLNIVGINWFDPWHSKPNTNPWAIAYTIDRNGNDIPGLGHTMSGPGQPGFVYHWGLTIIVKSATN